MRLLLIFLLWLGSLFELCKMEEDPFVEDMNRGITIMEKTVSVFTSEEVVKAVAKTTKGVTQILQVASSLTAVLGAAGPLLSLVMGFISLAMPKEDSEEAKLIKDLKRAMEVHFENFGAKMEEEFSKILLHLLTKDYENARKHILYLSNLHNKYMQSKQKAEARNVLKELTRECEASIPEKYLQEVALRFNNENMLQIVEGLHYDISKYFQFTRNVVQDVALAMKLFTCCMAYNKVDNASFNIRDELTTERYASIHESLRYGQKLIDEGWTNYLGKDIKKCAKDFQLEQANHSIAAQKTHQYLQHKYKGQEFTVVSMNGTEFEVYGTNFQKFPLESKVIIVMWVNADMACTFDKFTAPNGRELIPDQHYYCSSQDELKDNFFLAIEEQAPFNVTSLFVQKIGHQVKGDFETNHGKDDHQTRFYRLIPTNCFPGGRNDYWYKVYYVMTPACAEK